MYLLKVGLYILVRFVLIYDPEEMTPILPLRIGVVLYAESWEPYSLLQAIDDDDRRGVKMHTFGSSGNMLLTTLSIKIVPRSNGIPEW